MMVFPVVVPMREFSDEGEPLTEREELRRFMVRVVSFVIAVLLIHYFLVPNPLIEDVERALTWSENVNTVTVYDTNGVESSTLSGNCYIVGDSKVNTHGGSRPGPLAIRCYDGDVVVSYRVVEGASVTLEKSGGSFGFEESRATIREAGSSTTEGLSERRVGNVVR